MIGLLAGAAVYTLAGFLIAPRAIKLWIESSNVSGPDCRLRVQQVYVNPFTLYLSLRNVTLFEKENKMFMAVASADTQVWTVEKFRTDGRGHDIGIRNLVVTGAGGDETILTAPRVSARSVTVGAGGGFIDAEFVRLERPDAAITRDAAGIRRQAAWLSAPGYDRTGACISLDRFEVAGGRLRVTDYSVTPAVQLEVDNVVAGVRRKPGHGAAPTEIDVEGRIGAAGSITVAAQLGGPAGRLADTFSMNARNVDLQPLAPYFQLGFGRNIIAGIGDATLRLERDGTAIHIDNQLDIAGLRLGDRDAEIADDTLPLDLALALATDEADRTMLSIQDTVSDSPARSVAGLFIDSTREHLDGLATRPFEVLAGIAGRADAVLDAVAFLPGSAEMTPATTDTLALLALALGQRPLLGIRVRPAYDPAADRNAIAAQQVKLHIALATSAGARQRADQAEPDFDDPRVRDILDEFAGARLSAAQRRAIALGRGGDTNAYRDIYHALVANEQVSETVLRRLARFRARSVIDALARAGIDRTRFRIADTLDTVSTDATATLLRLEAAARDE